MSETAAPERLTDIISQLKEAHADGIAEAHAALQVALLGREGCLRTDEPLQVEWADAVWADIVDLLSHKNNHVRSIAGQMLSNLSYGADPARVLKDFNELEAVTHDEKFVTARHVLQSLWKVGLSAGKLRARYLQSCKDRYGSSPSEKNATLIRYDILVGMRSLFDITADVSLRELAGELIALETDEKYRKKYAAAWRDAMQESAK